MTDELERLYLRDVDVMIDGLRHAIASIFEGNTAGGGLDKAFRYAHSVKSQADALGKTAVARAAHAVEDLLSTARGSGRAGLDLRELDQAVATLRHVFDTGRKEAGQESGTLPGTARRSEDPASSDPSTAGGRGGGTAGGTEGRNGGGNPFAASRAALFGRPGSLALAKEQLTGRVRSQLREAEQRGERPYIVSAFLSSGAAMKDMRHYLLQTNLERQVFVLRTWTEDLPPGDGGPGHGGPGHGGPAAGSPAAGLTGGDQDSVSLFHAVVTTHLPEEELKKLVSVDEVVRVDIDAITSDEMIPASWTSGVQGQIQFGAAERSDLAAGELGRLIGSARRIVRDMDVGLESDRQHLIGILRSAAGLVSRSRQDLSDELSVRFDGVARSVADRLVAMGRERGKTLSVELLGAWTMVPRGLHGTLTDLMLQLGRNSLDHGLESGEERRAAGKPASGVLRLGARRDDRWISIWVEDDGRGVDEEAVRKLQPPSEKDVPLISLLSRPGFTTSDEAGSSSGRGVGLDVVQHTVETLLLGRLSLNSAKGEGSRFTLQFPAEARTLDVLICAVASRRLAVPRLLVDEVRPLTMQDYATRDQQGRFVSVDGAYRPICSTGLQQLPPQGAVGLVVNGSSGRAVLIADRIVAEERVLRYRSTPYQIYSQALDRRVGLLVPLLGC